MRANHSLEQETQNRLTLNVNGAEGQSTTSKRHDDGVPCETDQDSLCLGNKDAVPLQKEEEGPICFFILTRKRKVVKNNNDERLH